MIDVHGNACANIFIFGKSGFALSIIVAYTAREQINGVSKIMTIRGDNKYASRATICVCFLPHRERERERAQKQLFNHCPAVGISSSRQAGR